MRDEEIKAVGNHSIDIVNIEYIMDNPSALEKSRDLLKNIAGVIDTIRTCKYAKVRHCNNNNYTFHCSGHYDTGIVNISTRYRVPMEGRSNLDSYEKWIRNCLKIVEERINYWESPDIDLEKLMEEGRLYYRDEKGRYRKCDVGI